MIDGQYLDVAGPGARCRGARPAAPAQDGLAHHGRRRLRPPHRRARRRRPAAVSGVRRGARAPVPDRRRHPRRGHRRVGVRAQPRARRRAPPGRGDAGRDARAARELRRHDRRARGDRGRGGGPGGVSIEIAVAGAGARRRARAAVAGAPPPSPGASQRRRSSPTTMRRGRGGGRGISTCWPVARTRADRRAGRACGRLRVRAHAPRARRHVAGRMSAGARSCRSRSVPRSAARASGPRLLDAVDAELAARGGAGSPGGGHGRERRRAAPLRAPRPPSGRARPVSLRRWPRMATKRRLDALLVERGLVETRSRAQALIMAGRVHVERRAGDEGGHADGRATRPSS